MSFFDAKRGPSKRNNGAPTIKDEVDAVNKARKAKRRRRVILGFCAVLAVLACAAYIAFFPSVSHDVDDGAEVVAPSGGSQGEGGEDGASGGGDETQDAGSGGSQDGEGGDSTSGETDNPASSSFEIASVPAYSGEAAVEINGNEPFFSDSELTTTSYESYSPLDSLGRCGSAIACIGRDIMPTEERGEIDMIKPTGWHSVRYEGIVEKDYLYNRCHVIGYQLTGENANEQNLITGTRYMNTEGMEPYETMVAYYVKRTGNHVLYRSTPVFEGDNLLASGVLLEAKSVEDDGEGLRFCVWCYNVQPGIGIDYATGDSWLEEQAEASESSESQAEAASDSEGQAEAA